MRPDDVPAIVKVLNACQKDGWGDEALWRWKHRDRPGFHPEDVYVACVDGKVIGCAHWSVFPVEIEDGLIVPMSFDGDFAVLPEYRGLDAPFRAYLAGEPNLRERGALLRGGFTSPALNEKFYRTRFGYEFAASVTSQYRRFLGPGPLAERIAALGDRLLARPGVRRALAQPLSVELAIERFPVCWLELSAVGFCLMTGFAPRAQLHLQLPYTILTLFAGGGWPGTGTLMRALLGCRMHVTELVREAPRLLALVSGVVRG
jgi:predicted N-acetyltransferase YhbS